MLDEYLEKTIEAAFKREYEQDENIVRSLPFFATALGLVVAIFTQIITRVPVGGEWRLVLYALFAVSACVFCRILWCLFQVVRARDFSIPPNERALNDYALALREHYKNQGFDEAASAAAGLRDLRCLMIEAYAESAMTNRDLNRSKFDYRSKGFTWLVVLLALATLSVGVIFIQQGFHNQEHASGAGNVGRPNTETNASSPEHDDAGEQSVNRIISSQAGSPQKPDGAKRGEVSSFSRFEEVTDDGRTEARPATPAASTTAPASDSSADGDHQKE